MSRSGPGDRGLELRSEGWQVLRMRWLRWTRRSVLTGLTTAALLACPPADHRAPLEIAVSFDALESATAASATAFDGRVLLLLATDDGEEPRFQVTAGVKGIQVFGRRGRLSAAAMG